MKSISPEKTEKELWERGLGKRKVTSTSCRGKHLNTGPFLGKVTVGFLYSEAHGFYFRSANLIFDNAYINMYTHKYTHTHIYICKPMHMFVYMYTTYNEVLEDKLISVFMCSKHTMCWQMDLFEKS